MFFNLINLSIFRKASCAVFLFGLIFIGSTGCTRSLRDAGAKVAQAGSKVSQQMAEYYQSLQKDTIDTYEMNTFRKAYFLQRAYDKALAKSIADGTAPPAQISMAMTPLEDQRLKEYQQTYMALATRIKLCQAMRGAYTSYASLAEYNSAQEISNSVDGLFSTVEAAANAAFPNAVGFAATAVTALFKDLLRELATIKQNKKLLRESNRLIPVLEKFKQIFDKERYLYGGDVQVRDSTGATRDITGIAGARATAFRDVATLLVESEAVVSTAIINRVLSAHELTFPEQQGPFTQSAIKAGIIKTIISRASPLAQLSEDTADALSRSLAGLIKLHRELEIQKPLSLQEIAESSATAQLLLDQLKTRGVPSDTVIDILKLLDKGAKK